MDDLLEMFDAATLNLIEAIFWSVVGLVVMVRAWLQGAEPRRIGIIAGVWFIAFGLSDLIEIRTEAWYRPWWLLALKAACVVALVSCFVWYRAWRREMPRKDEEQR